MAFAYTRRLLGAIIAANGTITYTVPSGSTVVVRNIVLTNRAASATGCLVEITGSVAVYTSGGIATASTVSQETRVGLNAGETLTVYAFTNALHCVVTGYVFSNT